MMGDNHSVKVVGFGHRFIKALIPPPPPEGPDSEGAQPSPRIMHSASAGPFQALRTKMEGDLDAADDGCPRHQRCIAASAPVNERHRSGREDDGTREPVQATDFQARTVQRDSSGCPRSVVRHFHDANGIAGETNWMTHPPGP